MYMDFEEVISSPVLSLSTSSSSGWTAVGMEGDRKENGSAAKAVHPLSLRPWDITVLVNLHKVHGRLPVVSVPIAEARDSPGTGHRAWHARSQLLEHPHGRPLHLPFHCREASVSCSSECASSITDNFTLFCSFHSSFFFAVLCSFRTFCRGPELL